MHQPEVTSDTKCVLQTVPADVTRYGLSTIINRMLKLGAPPVLYTTIYARTRSRTDVQRYA